MNPEQSFLRSGHPVPRETAAFGGTAPAALLLFTWHLRRSRLNVLLLRRFMRLMVLGVAAMLLAVGSARADSPDPPTLFPARTVHEPWHIGWASSIEARAPTSRALSQPFPSPVLETTDVQALHPAAVEHSRAFETRSKIHKYASFATLPLFGVQLALGQSLYNGTGNTDAKKGAHAVVGAGIVGLFGVNTVTGVWNMFGAEGRRDKTGHALRLMHGLLMMAADVGFVATSVSTPDSHDRRPGSFDSGRSTHRNLAIASISVGTAGYLLMLFGNH